MADLLSCIDFEEFSESCLRKRRYALEEGARQFLDVILESASTRERPIEPSVELYRAQEGCRSVDGPYEEDGTPMALEVAYSERRLKPLDRGARQGRANPQGIPVLYLATDEKTAVSEIRPFVGARVSVASFSLKRQIRLVDCAKEHATDSFRWALSAEFPGRSLEIIWAKIDKAFMKPAVRDELEAEYAPTQIFAEHFRAAGYDGVYYKSALGPEFCVGLFDPSLANPSDAWVVWINKVEYSFEPSPMQATWNRADTEGPGKG